MKNTFTKKEVQWLLKRQIEKSVEVFSRMDYLASDEEVIKKLRTTKPVLLSEIKNIKP